MAGGPKRKEISGAVCRLSDRGSLLHLTHKAKKVGKILKTLLPLDFHVLHLPAVGQILSGQVITQDAVDGQQIVFILIGRNYPAARAARYQD